jgi:hypothetical protein
VIILELPHIIAAFTSAEIEWAIFLDFLFNVAQQSCNIITQHKGTKRTQSPQRQKNNDHFNLSLCLLWFLGGFVFEDSFAKKTKI